MRSDTLWLRDGTTRENVEVEFRREDVIVRHRSGKREILRKSDVMRLQVVEVRVPAGESDEIAALERELDELRRTGREDAGGLLRDELRRAREAGGRPREAREKAEKDRVSGMASRGLIWQPRPDEDKLSVGGSFAMGLIPGYSGAFRSGHAFGGGLLSVLETVALVNALDTATAYKDYSDGERLRMILYVTTRFYLIDVGYDFRGGVTNRTIVGDSGARTNRDKTKYDNTSYGVLLLFLLCDGIFSGMAAADWNDGMWEGTASVVPTTPLQRGVFSALYPGAGQVQAGNQVKGGLWAAAGTALLAAEINAESQLRRAQDNYEETSDAVFTRVLLGTLNNVAVVDIHRWIAYSSWEKREAINRASKQRNNLFRGLAALWILNIVDAVFLSGRNEVVSSGPSVTPEISFRPGSESGKHDSFFGIRVSEAW